MNSMDNHTKGYLYMVISTLLISIAFIFNTFALRGTNPTTGAFFVFGFSTIGTFAMLVATKKIGKIKQLMPRFWKPLLLIGVLNGVSATLWFYLLGLMGPSLLSFLLRFSTIFMIIMGIVFLKERFSKLEIVGGLIMIAGTFIISYSNGELILFGVSLAMILSAVFSAVQFLNKVYIKEIDPLVINALRVLFTFATVSTIALWTSQLAVPPLATLGWLALSSISAGMIGFLLNFKALQLIDLSKTAVIQSMQPFVVVLYSILLLGSVPSSLQMFGGIVIVVGTIVSVLARYKPKFIARFIPFD
ncbi:MAG: DMT family transporter [Candidatus Aenigmarchaeota archaeon]|nr:DMT family transporter [Candidatus Aenigmarchaeota archaeon]